MVDALPVFNTVDRQILEILKKEKKSTQSQIFKKVTGSYISVTRGVKKMVDKGILKKELNPESHREYLLSYSYNKLPIGDLIELLK